MGFDTYDDARLQSIVEHWRTTSTTPGSMGDKAKRESLEEWERRLSARRPPSAGGTQEE
jgi:hypothetical protein